MKAEKDVEKVMCIRREDLPAAWLSEMVAIKMPGEAFFDVMGETPFNFVARSEAEKDTARKQVIPYVLFQTADGFYTACYCRNGTEKRLHQLCSVGVGGHINPEDRVKPDSPLAAVVTNGMRREMSEEFRLLPEDSKPVFHGIINEEKTAVGRVHLGLVYRVQVWDRQGIRPGRELSDFGWVETGRVFQRPLELWSKLALNLVENEWR